MKQTALQFPRLFMNALVAIIGALGAVFCVTTAFDINVNVFVIVMASILAAMVFSFCFQRKKFLWLLLGLCLSSIFLSVFTDLFASVPPTLLQLLHDC